jgi:hypothetical protein
MINSIMPHTYQPRAAFRGKEDCMLTVFTPDPRKFMVEYLKKDIKEHPELKNSPLLRADIDHSNNERLEDNFVVLESRNSDAYKALKAKVLACTDKLPNTNIVE